MAFIMNRYFQINFKHENYPPNATWKSNPLQPAIR